MDVLEVPVVPALRRSCRGASGSVLVVTTVVFFGGWAFNVTALRNLVPGTVELKPMTAIALFFSAAALGLLLDAGVRRRRRCVGYACAAVPVLIGAAVLSEYVLVGVSELTSCPFAT